MGAYDTPHGGPLSPDIQDPYIFQEEEDALEILENSGIDSTINDQILKIIRGLCEKLYKEN